MADTTPKPFVFVLMPFAEEFEDVYKLGIKPACENAGAYAERVDEQIYTGSIIQRIYNQISKADVIVADMTGRNPNVFYEVGYAHALGKAVILLAQNKKDILFDLQDYPHIVYGGKITELIPEVERLVRWYIEHVGESKSLTLPHIQVYSNGRLIKNSPIINSTYHDFVMGELTSFIQLDINNTAEKVIRSEVFQLSVIFPNQFRHVIYAEDTESINLPDGQILDVLKKPIELFPGSWTSLKLAFINVEKDTLVKCVLRISTPKVTREYPFQVQFVGLLPGSG